MRKNRKVGKNNICLYTSIRKKRIISNAIKGGNGRSALTRLQRIKSKRKQSQLTRPDDKYNRNLCMYNNANIHTKLHTYIHNTQKENGNGNDGVGTGEMVANAISN